MTKLRLNDAARRTGVSRHVLRRAIASGRLRRDPDGRVDTAELERAGYTLQLDAGTHEDVLRQASDVKPACNTTGTPQPAREQEQASRKQEWLEASATVHLDLAGRQVQVTLHDSDEDRLLARLEAMLQRVPGAATPADDTPTREEAQGAALSPAQPDVKHREPIGYRIFDVLRQHPTGLTRKEIEQALGTTENLGDTLVGMVRYKRLVRVGKGIYALPPG